MQFVVLALVGLSALTSAVTPAPSGGNRFDQSAVTERTFTAKATKDKGPLKANDEHEWSFKYQLTSPDHGNSHAATGSILKDTVGTETFSIDPHPILRNDQATSVYSTFTVYLSKDLGAGNTLNINLTWTDLLTSKNATLQGKPTFLSQITTPKGPINPSDTDFSVTFVAYKGGHDQY